VVPVELPGKERLFAEEPASDIPGLIKAVLPTLRKAIGPDDRIAVFGHCFGAVAAYELARVLEEDGGDHDLALIASGSAAPGVIPWERLAGLDDDALVAAMSRNAQYRHAALDEPELRELLMPALRADVTAQETYTPAWATPFSGRVITVRGVDDTLVDADAVSEWRAVASSEPLSYELPGGHMYLTDQWDPLLSLLERALGNAI
jgi:surfactin synthase thioesterase subunit